MRLTDGKHQLIHRLLVGCLQLLLVTCIGSPVGRTQESPPPGQPEANHSPESLSSSDVFLRQCAAADVADSVFGQDELIEYVRGQDNLILAAPHGGREMPSHYPLRSKGVLVTDSRTDRLARAIRQELAQQFDCQSHLVICHLRRLALDANRPLEAACEPDSPAQQVWHDYQNAIDFAKRDVTEHAGRGLFIEIHGHGHTEQRLELGYLLRANDLRLPKEKFNQLADRSSVREICQRGQCDLDTLIRGEQSLGALLQAIDLKSVPSPKQTSPGAAPYFNGGWNTRQHGSRDGGVISSIQIEFHRDGVRDSDAAIQQTARRVARAIDDFLNLHYGPPITPAKNCPP